MHPSRGRFDALAIGAALTLSFGILCHLLVESVVTGNRLAWFTNSHALMSTVPVAALAWSFARVAGTGGSAERRRRLALIRAALRVDTPCFFVTVSLAQAAIATIILVLEGVAIAPGEMLAALVSGMLAVIAGTLALQLARRRMIAVLSSWARGLTSGPARIHVAGPTHEPRTCAAIPFRRSRPDRAPPGLLIA